MSNSTTVKAIISILILVADFGLAAVYVVQHQAPDIWVAGLISGSSSAVIAWYFGHQNGQITALAQAATTLATQATEKRAANPAGPPAPPAAGS